MKVTNPNRVRRNGSAKAHEQQSLISEPPAKVGFDLSWDDARNWYRILIPWPDGACRSEEGELQPEEFSALWALADEHGITVEQAMNRVWRDVFARADCGDRAEATPSACKRARPEADLGLTAREQTLVELLAEWLKLSPADYCLESVRGCFQPNLDWLASAAEGDEGPEDRADARRLLPRVQALFRGRRLEMSSFKDSPAVAGN